LPDFSTLCRLQQGLNVAIPYRHSAGALHLLIDSTGIKGEGEGDWLTKKHSTYKPRQWRKVHSGIDRDTLDIRAIGVTVSWVGDPLMLPELLDQILDDRPISKVSADGDYDTRGCLAAIAAGTARAIIPARKNARPWLENTSVAPARNGTLHATRRLGRTIWRLWSGYHGRSLVETKMRCLKLLVEHIMARDFERQVAGLQI
jgi:hypothetical protein